MMESSPYRRTVVAVTAALEEIRIAHAARNLKLSQREIRWLEKLDLQASSLPDSEDKAFEQALRSPEASKFLPEEYGW